MSTLANIDIILRAKAQQFDSSLDKAIKKIQMLDRVSERFNKANNLAKWAQVSSQEMISLGGNIQNVGRQMMMMGAALSAPAIMGVRSFAKFQNQMNEVSTMVKDSDRWMPDFSSKIRKMSVQYGESTATLSRGLYDILSASVPASNAMDVLTTSVRAARAGLVDTGTATSAIMTIINSYGMSTNRAADVSDLLFTIISKGVTTMGQLAPSIGQVTSLASSAGISLEELGASISTMTRAGVSTEMAVISLVSMINAFLKPSEEAAQKAEDLGIEMSGAALRANGLYDTFQKIAHLPPDTISTLFPNVRAVRGVLPLINNMRGFASDIEAMTNRAGASKTAFEKMFSGILPLLKSARYALENMGTALGEVLAKDVERMASALAETSDKIIFFVEHNKTLIRVATAAIIQFTLLGGALFVFGTAIKAAGVSLTIFQALPKITAWINGMQLATMRYITVLKIWVWHTRTLMAAQTGLIAKMSILKAQLISSIGVSTLFAGSIMAIGYAFSKTKADIDRANESFKRWNREMNASKKDLTFDPEEYMKNSRENNSLRTGMYMSGIGAPLQALLDLSDKIGVGDRLSNTMENLTDVTQRYNEMLMEQSIKEKSAIQAMEAAEKARQESINTTVASLQKQIDTFGMSQREVQLYNLMMSGASESVIKFAESLDRQLNILEQNARIMEKVSKLKEMGGEGYQNALSAMKEYQRHLEGIQSLLLNGTISQEEYQRRMKQLETSFSNYLDNQSSAMEKQKQAAIDLANEVQRMYDETRTPLERYEKQLNRIHELYNKGVIDYDLFSRMQKKIEEEYEATLEKYKPTDFGEFQTINTSIVDVAGLNLSGLKDPMQKQIEILEDIRDNTKNNNSGALS